VGGDSPPIAPPTVAPAIAPSRAQKKGAKPLPVGSAAPRGANEVGGDSPPIAPPSEKQKKWVGPKAGGTYVGGLSPPAALPHFVPRFAGGSEAKKTSSAGGASAPRSAGGSSAPFFLFHSYLLNCTTCCTNCYKNQKQKQADQSVRVLAP
jgi:hypothetical protein